MMISLPNLEEYDVSREYGFLSSSPPLPGLEDPYYEPWEFIMRNLQGLLLSKRLGDTVHSMPHLTTDRICNELQWRRAYSILAFIVHAYIWGEKQPKDWVPANLAIPFLSTCRHLELPPVATYAGLVLWNWRPIFATEQTGTLANLDIIETFTGSLDEKWFYLISVAIEARGASLIPLMLDAMQAASHDDQATVANHLRVFAETVDELGALLGRMYDNCDPHVFYHRLRPFLAGGKNMAAAGLPNGVVFDNGGPMNKQKYVQYSGGSNAQSSLIQFLDIALGVEHHPTASGKDVGQNVKDETPTKPKVNFIHDMRRYMPGPHARFLNAIHLATNIRKFVEVHRHNQELAVAYDASLAMLSAFRDKHLQIVARYIVVKSNDAKKKPTSDTIPLSLPLRSKPDTRQPKVDKLVGTGGTSLIPFLQQARRETGEAAIGVWAHRLLNQRSQQRKHTSEFDTN